MKLPNCLTILALLILMASSSMLVAAEEQTAPDVAPALGAKAQPPLLKAEPVPEKNVPTLAEPLPTSRKESVLKAPVKAVAAPLAVTVQLNIGNAELRGSLLSDPEFSMKTAFGELTIPLSEVAGIKLANEGNTSTTVVMHNGDSVTGAWDFDHIELRTEWGRATVDGTAINSLLFSQGMAWVSEGGVNGKRWKLMARPDAENEPSVSVSQVAQGLKQGDVVVVARGSTLRAGEDVVGKVAEGEVLAIEGVLDSWYYVNNGKVAGWISRGDVSVYREPGSESAAAQRAQARSR